MKLSPLEVCPGIVGKGKTSRGERKGKKISKELKLKFIEIAEKHGPTAAQKSLVLIALVTTTLKLKNKTGFLMTKKRVKKYNRVEAARRNNERILKGLAVCYFVNDNTPKQDIILTNLKGERAHITKTMSDAITCHRYKWQIYLCAGTTNTRERVKG